jgi:hypothetical protein
VTAADEEDDEDDGEDDGDDDDGWPRGREGECWRRGKSDEPSAAASMQLGEWYMYASAGGRGGKASRSSVVSKEGPARVGQPQGNLGSGGAGDKAKEGKIGAALPRPGEQGEARDGAAGGNGEAAYEPREEDDGEKGDREIAARLEDAVQSGHTSWTRAAKSFREVLASVHSAIGEGRSSPTNSRHQKPDSANGRYGSPQLK